MVGRPKRGQSRLSPQPDADVDRLRREVDEELRHLSTEDDCCISVRLEGERVAVRQWLNLIAGDGIEITAVDDPRRDEIDVTVTATGAGGGAPDDAEYIVAALNAGLSAERVLTEGHAIDVAFGAGTATVSVDETEMDMYGAPFITTAASADLGAESVLTAGHAIDITSGGGTTTIDVDESELIGVIIADIDFTAEPNNTFANGAESIGGFAWTAANVAASTIFDTQAGTGLRWTAPTSTPTDFTTSAQTAAHLYIDLSSFPLWRPEDDLIIEIYYTGTFENGNDGFLFGVWGQANTPVNGTSGIRMEMVGRVNSGGTQTLRTLHNATQGTALADVSGTDVAAGRFRNVGTFDQFFGTYSGGFPTGAYQAAAHQVTTQGAANPMFASNSRLALAFRCASDASPTTAITLLRMRLRRAS
jgi:hypothetical protein